ncbi:MAG: TonB-dependent receptor [Burkholderiaceae bacterium]|nr:TonB-dependent receptor [Burkholderiaceae bacterium]
MKKNASSLRARALAAACLVTAPPFALAQPASGHPLPETVVTASRIEQRVQDALPASTVITRQDIERAQTSDLPTLLSRVAGVQIAQTGGMGSVSSLFIRGAESRHTLVLVDGVPVNNLTVGTSAIEHLSLANIERIEIVRGNVSAIYGSAALGGVVQIFTRGAPSTPQASVTAMAGPRDAYRLDANASVRLATGTSVSAGAEKLRGQQYNYTKQAALPGTNPDVDGYEREAFSASIVHELGTGSSIGLRLRNAEGTIRYDSAFGPANQADVSEFRESGASLDTRLRLADGLTAIAQLGTATDEYDTVDSSPFSVGLIKSNARIAKLGLEWQYLPQQRLTAGYETTRQKIRVTNAAYANTTRDLDSLRLGWQADVGRHQFQLHTRRDDYSDYGSSDTYYAGYGFRLTEAWRLSASHSTGFNAPTFADLYYPGYSNPAMRPERLKSSEIGLQYAAGGHEVRATVFENRYRDLIAYDPVTFGPNNVAFAKNEGVELGYTGRFGATAVRAGLTVQDPVNSTTGARLARRADTLANLGLSHDIGPWSFNGDLRYTGERPDGARRLGGYTRVDVAASYALNKQFRLLGRIDNLTDKDETTAFGYRLPGRSLFVGINWQPGL